MTPSPPFWLRNVQNPTLIPPFLKRYRLQLMQLAGHAVSYGDVGSLRCLGPRVEALLVFASSEPAILPGQEQVSNKCEDNCNM